MEFGDELIIESYRIQGLIWIQLLVMVLLFIVLFIGISVLNLDTSSTSEETSVSPSASRHAALPIPIHLTDSTSSHNIVKEEDGSSTSEENANDDSALKNSLFMRFFRYSNHLCNYIRLVKRAILKCFGVDSTSENSNCRHHKQD